MVSESPDALEDVLRSALQDQVRVLLHVGGAELGGVVARVDRGVVELREGAERTSVRLERIDAIRRK